MSVSRRSTLGGLVGLGAAAGLASCAQPGHASNDDPANSDRSDRPQKSAILDTAIPTMPSRLLVNKTRAHALMEAQGVDLLICSELKNIYYLTNQTSMTYMLGMNDYAYATLSADPDAKPSYITSRFGLYFEGVGDTEIYDQLDVRLFSLPDDPEAFAQLTKGRDMVNAPISRMEFPKRHALHPQQPIVDTRYARDALLLSEATASADAALLKAIYDTDFKNKTVAIDHPKLRRIIELSGLDLKIVDGDRLIRNIRLQKTAQELDLARYTISANVAAAKTAAKSIRNGASFVELRHAYTKACGEHMTSAYWMVVDSTIPDLSLGNVSEGRSFMIDCVNEFQGYHGDYGRTVCVGEPNREMQAVINGLSHVWDRILPTLKVGTKYSDIFALGYRLFAETGLDYGFALNPHSVGINHTDEPSKHEFGPYEKDDIVLVENMVLSVDMPFLDSGLGGTAHLEDLVLIGKDGPELLNRTDDRMIVV